MTITFRQIVAEGLFITPDPWQLDPLKTTENFTLSNHNLTVTVNPGGANDCPQSEISVSSGKWYCELTSDVGVDIMLGVVEPGHDVEDAWPGDTALSYGWYDQAEIYNDGNSLEYGEVMEEYDVLMMALDMDNGKIWWGKNGTWFENGDPAAGTNPAYTGLSGEKFVALWVYDEDDEYTINFGYTTFSWIVPTGFVGFNGFNRSPAKVPSIVGELSTVADAEIVLAGLVVGNVTSTYSETIWLDEIMDQSPTAGTTVPLSSSVDYEKSLGMGGIDSYVKLMLHMDGVQNETDFPDSSSSAHTVTPHQNGGYADTLTGLRYFPIEITKSNRDEVLAAARILDGGYLSVPDSPDWDVISAGNYTIDFWLHWARTPEEGTTQYLISQYDDVDNYWALTYVTGGVGDTGFIFEAYDGGSPIIYMSGGSFPTSGPFAHIAMVKDGTSYKIYMNGSVVASTSDSSVKNYTGELLIGIHGDLTSPMWGNIDELRLSQGIARWTNSFSGDLNVQPYSVVV